MIREIVVRGARVHNLRDVDVSLPREALVVVTGPSGSGKSSLAFDTIYAEAQRRYLQSLSAHAREVVARVAAPDVDSITGLSPTLAIGRASGSRNPRSTVGSLTEIHDSVRVLYGRLGVPHCPSCAIPVVGHPVADVVERIVARGEGSRLVVLAPVLRAHAGDARDVLEKLRREGFARVRFRGETRDLGELDALPGSGPHDLDVVIDRIVLREGVRARVRDAVELAYRVGGGRVIVGAPEAEDVAYAESPECSRCGRAVPSPSPRLFSWNGPEGACPSCSGLGETRGFSPARIVPDPSLSIGRGAVVPFGRADGSLLRRMLERLAGEVDVDAPFGALDDATRRRVLEGEGARPDGFEGVIPWLERRLRETTERRHAEGADAESIVDAIEDEFGPYVDARPCVACAGARLRPEALAVRLSDLPLGELLALPVERARARLVASLPDGGAADVAKPLLAEIEARLAFLAEVGLGYLSLDRGAPTLSSGELQRIRLAAQLGGGLVGMIYVLDEPTAGLHPKDVGALLDTLSVLRERGNTVILVEHEAQAIARADHLVELGPGAGPRGGRLVAAGSVEHVARIEESPTGAYLRRLARPASLPRRRRLGGARLEVRGVSTHNLRSVDVGFPMGALTCVTGVSGSGKSSLVSDTLVPWARHVLHGASAPGVSAHLVGLEAFERIVSIDAEPIGRTPRSNPASYSGVLALLRDVYASLPEARSRGYAKTRFSPNVKGGRCETCKGEGLVRVDLRFLSDVFVVCEACGGTRFDRDTLDIKLRGASIADVLAMSIDDAAAFFEAYPAISERLETMRRVGLGYLALGRSATTLSGGEAQRLKLARELGRRGSGKTLYVLDEPTAGLHAVDVEVLVSLLRELVAAGHTVIVIEHHLDVVLAADHVIDLGPGGGPDGGRVVAEGTPEAVAAVEASATGRAIAARLTGLASLAHLATPPGVDGSPSRPDAAPKATKRRPRSSRE